LHDASGSVSVAGYGLTPLIYNGLQEIESSMVGVNPETGLKEIFNVPYTQFVKVDLRYIASIYISNRRSLAFRALAGHGWPRGNSPSLPYEQAFFAGGSNDIRAFQARTMAPGSVKTYADSNSTETQIGDMRFEANFEYRFQMTPMLEGALFADAGNIWNRRKEGVDTNDPSVIKWSSWREIALGVGYGIRADFDFLIVRLDLSWALHNPHLPAGERWWLSGEKTEYKSYFDYDPDTGEYEDYELPHPLRFNFGIGYPF
jgi:outer membrane protein assembly factor BamA